MAHIRVVIFQKCESVAKVSTKLNFEILFSVTLAGFFLQSAQSRVLNKWRPIQLKHYRFCSWHSNPTVQKFRKVLKINSFRYSKRFLNNHSLVFLHQGLNRKLPVCRGMVNLKTLFFSLHRHHNSPKIYNVHKYNLSR